MNIKNIISRIRLAYKKNKFIKKIGDNELYNSQSISEGIALGCFSLDYNLSKDFYINNIEPGEYRIVLFHEDKYIAKNRKSLLVAFDVMDVLSDKAILKRLGLKNTSQKYGVFQYIGGGVSDNNIFFQDVYLKIDKKCKVLKLSFHSQIDRYINIEQLYLYNFRKTDQVQFDHYYSDLVKGAAQKQINNIFNTDLINLDFLKQDKYNNIDILICTEMNPNVIDGSSIWLSSVISILSSRYNVLVLFKSNITAKNNILSNIQNDFEYLQPSNFNVPNNLNVEMLSKLCTLIDNSIDKLKYLITRGLDLAIAIQEKNNFYNRHMVYVTNFYEHSDDGNIFVPENNATKLQMIACNSDIILTQTQFLSETLRQFSIFNFKEVRLPPSLPNNVFEYQLDNSTLSSNNNIIHIGYAGKLKEDWAIDELLTWTEKFNEKYTYKIQVHLAIARIDRGDENFFQRMKQLIQLSHIKVYEGLDREAAIKLMASMNFAWSYRKPDFENNTLELSTKLLETIASKVPTLCYPSKVNMDLLGEKYPFYIEDEEAFFECIDKNRNNKNNKKLMEQYSQDVKQNHSFSKLIDRFNFIGTTNSDCAPFLDKKICFAGNDFKFIDPFISYLKNQGVPVKKNNWEWGAIADEKLTKECYEWSDIIFCEWGLANAVWFSEKNIAKKPLYIRIHAQEVRERARKFGAQINIENVSKVIFISERVRREAIKLWNWPESKTIVIPNFYLSDRFTLRNNKLSFNLGMVGIVPQLKRFDRAVHLLKELVSRGHDAKLYIKGHRPEEIPFMHSPSRKLELDYYYSVYKEIDDDPLIKDRVIYSGWGNDVALWYQNIDFILSPSDSEGCHNAFGEGILSGCLPIGWPWEGFEYTYSPEFLIKNIKEAADKVEFFHSKRNIVNTLRQQYKKQVEEIASTDVVFSRLLQEIRKSI